MLLVSKAIPQKGTELTVYVTAERRDRCATAERMAKRKIISYLPSSTRSAVDAVPDSLPNESLE